MALSDNDILYVAIILVILAIIIYLSIVIFNVPTPIINRKILQSRQYPTENNKYVSLGTLLTALKSDANLLKKCYAEFNRPSYNQLLFVKENVDLVDQIYTDLDVNFRKRFPELQWQSSDQIAGNIIEKNFTHANELIDSRSDSDTANEIFEVRHKILCSINLMKDLVKHLSDGSIKPNTKIYIARLHWNIKKLYSNVTAKPEEITLPEYYTNSNFMMEPETLYKNSFDPNTTNFDGVPVLGNRENSRIGDVIPYVNHMQKNKTPSVRMALRSDT